MGNLTSNSAADIADSHPLTKVHNSMMNVFIILDNSGSMSGSRWNTAKEGIMKYIRNLESEDIVHLMCFGHKLQIVATSRKKDLKVDKLFDGVAADGCCTKLYDAIMHGGAAAVKAHLSILNENKKTNLDLHTHIIVLTDGKAV